MGGNVCSVRYFLTSGRILFADLVAVDVPAGEHAPVLAVETPGQRLGFLALGADATIVTLHTVVWTVCHRCRRHATAQPSTGRVEI